MEDLPQDLADYYLYDLGEVEGGYRPKASRVAAEEDSPSVSSTSPTAEEMRGVGCPVALVRASQGFFPGSDPLISDEVRDEMASARHPHGDTAERREPLHDAMARVHAGMGSQGLRSTLLGKLSLVAGATLLRRMQP